MKLYVDIPPTTNKLFIYEHVTWDGNIKKKIRTIYNCKHCIAVDLILKYNQKGTMLGRVRLIIYSNNRSGLCDVTLRGVMVAYTTAGNSKYSYF